MDKDGTPKAARGLTPRGQAMSELRPVTLEGLPHLQESKGMFPPQAGGGRAATHSRWVGGSPLG